MKRNILLTLILFFSTAAFSLDYCTSAEPKPGEYVVYVSAENWGAVTKKIVVSLTKPVARENLIARNFAVENVMMFTDSIDSRTGNDLEDLPIESIFLCDSHGNPLDESVRQGNYIAFTFTMNPEDERILFFCKSILPGSRNYHLYSIHSAFLSISCTRLTAVVFPEVLTYKTKTFTWDDITLNYAYYEPEQKQIDMPVIVWFHGIAEGGSNPYMPVFGTKADSLSREIIQKYFEKGCYVIYPQCPTGWLETTTTDMFGMRVWEPVDIEGTAEKLSTSASRFFSSLFGSGEKTPDPESASYAKVSYYSQACKKLIDTFVADHPDIDGRRIYIGGCSAGGYMTLNMLLQYPNYFAAGFTSCEAFLDSKITDEEIDVLKKIPLWFVQAENDEAMNKDTHSYATWKRLKEKGAQNLHYSLFKTVNDGTFEYNGHDSWIYIMNDMCRDGETFLFQWLSKQKHSR